MGGVGGGGGVDPCDIVQTAPLNSPQPAVIAGISVGQVLDVVLNETSGRAVLEVRAPAGVAGALTHRGHILVINCIRTGRRYRAIVVMKSGGSGDVRVEPA